MVIMMVVNQKTYIVKRKRRYFALLSKYEKCAEVDTNAFHFVEENAAA